ncbi:MAG: hypothetical protein ACOY6K_21580 [Pseudomonadota bacterium]
MRDVIVDDWGERSKVYALDGFSAAKPSHKHGAIAGLAPGIHRVRDARLGRAPQDGAALV